MKIRTGFVSNSSSSSFLVAFPRVPKNADEVKEALFGTEIWYEHPYGDVYDNKITGYPTSQVAETVWNDMSGQVPNDEEKMQEALGSYGWELDNIPPIHDSQEYHMSWKTREIKARHNRDVKLREWTREHKNKFTYVFKYGDEDGAYYSALEHGTLFDRLPHERISEH